MQLGKNNAMIQDWKKKKRRKSKNDNKNKIGEMKNH